MVTGLYTADGSKRATLTDGAGNLVVTTTTSGAPKQRTGSQSPDGSIYIRLVDGAGNNV